MSNSTATIPVRITPDPHPASALGDQDDRTVLRAAVILELLGQRTPAHGEPKAA